jgi:hypothetical protein
MKKNLLSCLALALLVPSLALASGASVPTASLNTAADPMSVTETLKCTVVEIAQDGTVVVKDNASGQVNQLALEDDTPITTKNKAAFGGRKALQASDLAVGQVLKITHRPAAQEIVRIRVLSTS